MGLIFNLIRNNDIMPDLIAAHSLSGCDTVVYCFGIGKGTTVKILRSGFHFHAVGNTDTELPAVIQEATTIVSACYGYPNSKSLSETRHKLCKNKVGQSSKSVSNLSTLPPTTESFSENVKHAHLQACTWMYALSSEPSDMLPKCIGWLRNEAAKTLSPTTVPRGVTMAPDNIFN